VIFNLRLFAVLYYLGVMQLVIKAAAWLMIRLIGVSGRGVSECGRQYF